MELAEVKSLLRREIGLNHESIGEQALASAVQARLAATRSAGLEAYLRILAGSLDELAELIEEIVVPETWFFRGPAQLAFLARHAVERQRARPAGAAFRVLSVPCSTGEEPYSIAMVLLDGGLPPDRFRVDAVDVSRRALGQARQALYGENSFREKGPEWQRLRERLFVPERSRWRLLDGVRDTVHFRAGNLAAANFLAGEPPYDAVFCRNLLIYLDAESRARALASLHRLVVPTGLAFMGHAEPLGLWDARFRRTGPEQGFAFGKGEAAAPASHAGAAAQPPRPASGRAKAPGGATPPSPPAPRNQAAAPAPASDGERGNEEAPLDRAERLANVGHLEAAQAACDEFLRESAPRARAYYLLGLFRRAGGDAVGAEGFFTRALYLEPRHRESLINLALLAEARGDGKAAANYRRRLHQAGEG